MNASQLAKAFAEELNSTLTAEQMDEVNRLNAEEADKNICHSHDFCDANQVMIDVLGEEFENSDEQNKLISEAWEIAKNAEFSVSFIERDEREMDARG
jgi:hypothetical protein